MPEVGDRVRFRAPRPSGPSRGSALRLLAIGVAAGLLALSAFGAVGTFGGSLSARFPHGSLATSLESKGMASEVTSGLPGVPPTTPASGGFGWTNLTYGAAPSEREEFGLAYDALDRYVVLFGGIQARNTGLGHDLNDTWTYRDGGWTNITSTAGPSPPARDSPAMAFDAADGYVVLTGGSGFSPSGNGSRVTFTDTWAFSAGHWSQVNTSWPAVLSNPCQGLRAADDSATGFVLVLDPCSGFSTGGVAIGYKNGTWTDLTVNATTNASIPTPGYVDPVLVDEPTLGGVALFGGSDGFNHAAYNETLLYAGGKWTDETTVLNGTPPGRDFGRGDFDAAYPGFLLWGGEVSVPPLESTNVTWILHNRTWTDVTGSSTPRPVGLGPMVWDGADNASIEFGGLPNETWSWGQSPSLVGLGIETSANPIDQGASAQFSATFQGGVSPYNYTWTFGDGAGSSAAAPSHTYAALGNHTVTLQVRDAAGHSRNASIRLSVTTALTASIAAAPNPIETGSAVAFSAQLSGGAGSEVYNWSFGDGPSSVSSLAQPSHSYSAVGNYSVHLLVVDTGGTQAQATANVQVVSRLLAPVITASPTAPELGQLVNFTATESTGIPPYQYSWAFGDGGTGGNLSAISHIFTTNGPFVASVTVVDAQGIRATGTLNLTIALNVTALGNWSAGAAPLLVGFHSSVVGGVPGYLYAWTFGDGASSTVAAPTHQFLIPGFYTTAVRVLDSKGSSAQSEWTVFVAPSDGGPLAVTLSSQPARVAPGGTSLVSASISGGVGGFSLQWTDPGVECAPAGPLGLRCTPSAAGTYVVTLGVQDQAGHSVRTSTQIIAGGTVGLSGPPEGLSVNWTDVAGIAAVAAAIALVALVAVGRRHPPEGPIRGSGADGFAAYRTTAPGTPPSGAGGTLLRKGSSTPPQADPPETDPRSDPLSDLE